MAATGVAEPHADLPAAPPDRGAVTGRDRVRDRLATAALVAQAAGILALVAPMLTRPLWYNEQWRGWFLSLDSAPFRPDPLTPAPMSFGYAAVERVSTALLGRTELGLRAPSAVAFVLLAVVAYRLARRWLGVAASTLTVGALLLNRMVVTFGAELAPYTVEAACVTALLLCWFGAQDATTSRGRAVRYVAMVLLAVVATPAILLLGPLLAVDAVRALRARTFGRLVPAALAGGAAAVHVLLYVMPQSKQRHGQYWADYFLPREPLAALAAVWRGLTSYVPAALTGGTAHLPSVPDGEIDLPGGWRAAVIALMVAALVAGLAHGLRDRRVRPLAVAVLGCLGLQVVASLVRAWPFGFTRVNTFLLPLLYVLAAVGVARTATVLRTRRVARAGAAVAGVAAYALVVAVGARQVGVVRAEVHGPAFGTSLATFVGVVRQRAAPDDVVLLVHQMTVAGWRYYMHVREGGEGLRLPSDQALPVSQKMPDEQAIERFLAAHAGADHVYLVAVRGTPPSAVRAVRAAVEARGYVEAAAWRVPDTGGLVEFVAATNLPTGGA